MGYYVVGPSRPSGYDLREAIRGYAVDGKPDAASPVARAYS